MDDNSHQSADDALEDTRPDDIFDPQADEEKLPEDNDSPAAPPSGTTGGLPADHPVTDTNLDSDEIYSEGLAAATDTDKTAEDSDDKPAEPLAPESSN